MSGEMRAAIVEKPGVLKIREVLIPKITDDEVLIKVKLTGICGTDGFKINLHKKDMQNVLSAGSSLNIPLPLSAQLLEMLKSLSVSGNGELDHSAIVKFYENISGIEIM